MKSSSETCSWTDIKSEFKKDLMTYRRLYLISEKATLELSFSSHNAPSTTSLAAIASEAKVHKGSL